MSIKVIYLGGRKGLLTIIDESDYNIVNKYSWFSKGNKNYVTAKINNKDVYLHRLLMSPPPNMVVDHINGSTLDNRRENLRVCTPKENSRNSIVKITNQTGIKGVSYSKKLDLLGRKCYSARCYNNDGKRICLGYFKTSNEAGIAYANFAKTIHNEFFNESNKNDPA